jgi:integrase/recombinase XerD
MNSRQGSRYIKRRMGDDLKNEILVRNGIIQETYIKNKPSVLNCARCQLVNTIESKYCSKCSYPLKPEAYDEIKLEEDKRMKILEENQKLKDEQITQLIAKQEKFEQLIHSMIESGQLKPKIL